MFMASATDQSSGAAVRGREESENQAERGRERDGGGGGYREEEGGDFKQFLSCLSLSSL